MWKQAGFISASHHCTECWAGSRGVDCKEDCAPGFYGRLCREKCACDPCDKVKGCENVPTEYMYYGSTGMYIFFLFWWKNEGFENFYQ